LSLNRSSNDYTGQFETRSKGVKDAVFTLMDAWFDEEESEEIKRKEISAISLA
jgi:hypothetical protein